MMSWSRPGPDQQGEAQEVQILSISEPHGGAGSQ